MCREKAAEAEREMKYWIEEANEWKRLSETSVHHVEDGPLQIDCSSSEEAPFSAHIDAPQA
jgi:hypothetical protein